MTECARCGDCCERIPISAVVGRLTAMLANPRCAGEARRDAVKIMKLMTPTGDVKRVGDQVRQIWTCAAFDAVHRLCTAHVDRPELCSRYPWYDRPASGEAGLPTGCSFWIDVPREERPEYARPLLPLEILR